MKKTIFLLAALLSQTVTAVHLSQTGQGEVLLIPYYTVNNQYNTTVNVFNHDTHGKAVKIHIREGHNGASVLSYNVYLTPEDSWTFALGPHIESINHPITGLQNQDSGKQVTFDQSCAPTINKSGENFSREAFNVSGEPTRSFTRAREGFIEIIEMATVDPNSSLHEKLTVTENGTLNNCQSVTDMWHDGDSWGGLQNHQTSDQLLPPTGTLSVEATLINSQDGVQFPMEVIAFENFFESNEIHHTEPRSNEPSLNHGMKQAVLLNNGQTRILDFESGVDAVSALLMKKQISIQYNVDDSVAAATETAVTFPTRRFYLSNTIQHPPFDFQIIGSHCYSKRGSNKFFTETFDRNGIINLPGGGVLGWAPPEPPPPQACGTTSVLQTVKSYHASTDILKSLNVEYLDKVYAAVASPNGVHMINFASRPIVATTPVSGETIQIDGIPVIGVNFRKSINANAAPGLLAQYGFSSPIKTTIEAEITN